ncbi:hypothetical protein DFH06DRAFT_1135415 [Mycena polygramma]|nr:hypothetical protein DFH06DRAFT_1135415 [Mycena polygramma]
METMDGFPVVTLHDSPDEVEFLLKAIFDSSFFMPPPAKIQHMHILGILRLSHKYDVPYLRRRALEHLGTVFPIDLAKYDIRAGHHNTSSALAFCHRIRTLAIATEVDALWLLPVVLVYHDLCKYSMEVLVPGKYWSGVGEKEQERCRIGHSAQMRHLPKILCFLFVSKEEEDGDCDDWSQCNMARLQTLQYPPLWSAISWPLEAWRERDWDRLEAYGLCMTEARNLHDQSRQHFWDQLPPMFGLPEWEELKASKELALSNSI